MQVCTDLWFAIRVCSLYRTVVVIAVNVLGLNKEALMIRTVAGAWTHNSVQLSVTAVWGKYQKQTHAVGRSRDDYR